MKTTLAAMLALLTAGLIGCSSKSDTKDTEMMAGDEAISKGGPHDDWTRIQDDPVCGHTINPKAAYTETFDNQTYYFDTEECAQKFKAHPEAYFPAKDPVCGMTVEPKMAMYSVEYDHHWYYFDNKDCALRFTENPHAYMPGGDDRPGMKEAK